MFSRLLKAAPARVGCSARSRPVLPCALRAFSGAPGQGARASPAEVEQRTKVSGHFAKGSHAAQAGEEHSRPSYAVPTYTLPHPVWNEAYTRAVPVTHRRPEDMADRVALLLVRRARFNFDYISLYKFGKMSEAKWLVRLCFLETVAGCPGFVAAMLRHFQSLRRMQRDNGWIHTLLEEAENERMHLLTFIELYKPGWLFRAGVVGTQGLVSNALFLSYLLSPRTVHRFVGYLEEEAVITYTHCLEEIDKPDGTLAHWRTKPAPQVAKDYWQLAEGATMRDVILQVRADESHHRDVNHVFSDLVKKGPNEKNPFAPGS